MTRKSPVAAALWLVNTMFCLAALYVLLDAQFIGVIQVLVYAGAIMVVFLFVIMLLNLGHVPGSGDIQASLRQANSWRGRDTAAGGAECAGQAQTSQRAHRASRALQRGHCGGRPPLQRVPARVRSDERTFSWPRSSVRSSSPKRRV